MTDEQGSQPAMHEPVQPPQSRGLPIVPTTKAGWWAIWLAAAFVVAMAINQVVLMDLPERTGFGRTLLIIYGLSMMACGLAAGVVAAFAIIRKRERGLLVWLMLAPALFVIMFLVGEIFVPH